jgi:hypothetical protein
MAMVPKDRMKCRAKHCAAIITYLYLDWMVRNPGGSFGRSRKMYERYFNGYIDIYISVESSRYGIFFFAVIT